MELLVLHRGKLITRTKIYDHIFGEDDDSLSNLVEVHVSHIRKKLGADFMRHGVAKDTSSMVKSLRWRLQIWHALILSSVLLTFGSILYWQMRRTAIEEVNSELLAGARGPRRRLNAHSHLINWKTSPAS